MSTNAPMDMKDLIVYLGQQPAPDPPSAENIPTPHEQNVGSVHRLHSLKLWRSLLLIICLGSLGSLSLAPYMLPDQINPPVAAATVVPIKNPSPAPTVVTSTPIVGPFRESECIATSRSMKYLPVLSGKPVDKPLPPAWDQAGRSQKDLPDAKACAASFIVAYQSFNANNPKTFEASTSMLTNGARQRFYGTASHIAPDRYMDPIWRAAMQQKNVQQKAQVSEPTFLDAQYINGRLLVWMAVLYQRTIFTDGNQPAVENIQTTILLVNVPINVQKTGTGWQVSQWQNGKTVFAPPEFL